QNRRNPVLNTLATVSRSAGTRCSGANGLRLFCWINWWLFVLNLIPAFPFDGGQLCLASVQVAKPGMSREQAVATVAMLARVVSIGLLLAAVVLHDAVSGSPIPTWLPLVLLAIFVFFSARVEEVQARHPEEEEETFGYDFSQGYTSLERSSTTQAKPERPSWFARMLEERRERRQRRQEAREADEERQMDEILQRLHTDGQDSLTPAERALLKRVSARYRSKR
ncbi:MAG: site-2 protease family protein, partial [Planctomycetota bacterium]